MRRGASRPPATRGSRATSMRSTGSGSAGSCGGAPCRLSWPRAPRSPSPTAFVWIGKRHERRAESSGAPCTGEWKDRRRGRRPRSQTCPHRVPRILRDSDRRRDRDRDPWSDLLARGTGSPGTMAEAQRLLSPGSRSRARASHSKDPDHDPDDDLSPEVCEEHDEGTFGSEAGDRDVDPSIRRCRELRLILLVVHAVYRSRRTPWETATSEPSAMKADTGRPRKSRPNRSP